MVRDTFSAKGASWCELPHLGRTYEDARAIKNERVTTFHLVRPWPKLPQWIIVLRENAQPRWGEVVALNVAKTADAFYIPEKVNLNIKNMSNFSWIQRWHKQHLPPRSSTKCDCGRSLTREVLGSCTYTVHAVIIIQDTPTLHAVSYMYMVVFNHGHPQFDRVRN